MLTMYAYDVRPKGAIMHVLPLPWGLALALIPRRDAELIRRKETAPINVYRRPAHRERILADIRHADSRQHLV